MRVWDADKHDVETERPGQRSLVVGTAVDCRRGLALTVSIDGAIGMWSIEDGRSLGVLGVHRSASGQAWQPGDAATGRFVCHQVALAPDGRHAVSVGLGRLCWWDLDQPTRGCVRTMDAPHEYVTRVLWTVDGTMWVQAGRKAWIETEHEWKLVDMSPGLFRRVGDEWQEIALPTEGATHLAISPDGRFVAMVPPEYHQVVLGRLWPDHIEPLYRYLSHDRPAIAATFLPDSQSILTVGHDRHLRWWEVESGKSLGTVGQHEREIHDVAVSADGKIAVTVADDWWLAVWDIHRGKLRACFRTEGAMVRVSTDPRAEIIVSGDEAGRPVILRRISRYDSVRLIC